MSENRRDFDQLLDEALAEIQHSAPDAASEARAVERVWARLRAESAAAAPTVERHSIRHCADFQALIPAYLDGALVEARRLLVQDHVTECVPCRRALRAARDARRQGRTEARPEAPASWAARWTWRVAVAAAIVVGFVGLSIRTDLLTLEAGGVVHIESIDGEAFRVSRTATVPVRAGEEVSFEDAQMLRIGKDSRAMLRLEDGSRVEVNERAELAVSNERPLWRTGRGDAVIDLGRGTVIVEASDQGSGHLFVDTPDARVAVTGTVFAVNHGVKGSRVSVLEGEVHVDHAGETAVLHPGEQSTTSAALGRVAIEDEIAWSRQLDRHLELLRAFARLGRDIDAAIRTPGQRHDTTLLDRVPAGTYVYVALPNVSDTLGQAYDLMQQRVAANDLLRQWWQDSVVGTGADREIAEAMAKIRAFGRQIGEEIVVAVGHGPAPDGQARVLVLARALDARALRELVAAEIESLHNKSPEAAASVVLLGGGAVPPAGADALYVWIGGDYLAASPSLEPIREFEAGVGGGEPSAFRGTPFHGRVAELYAEGVEWVVGVDVEALRQTGEPAPSGEQATLDALGITDLQHIIGEHEEAAGRSENRAVLIFDQPRRGVASWLAEPAPMGALDFVSPNAYFAAGFLMREPVQVVDELLAQLGTSGPEALRGIEEFEQRHSIDLRDDIAAAIGGEFAFALDGPVLPKPSWKLVVEVYDPERLASTIERAVGRLNELMREHGKSGFAIEREESQGRTWYELKSLDTGLSAHYVFVDGYLVASASRVLLDRALQFRASGLTIYSNPAFAPLLPRDGEVHFSALVFQNWGSIVEPLAQGLRQGGVAAGTEARALVGQLGVLTAPNLTLAYGEPNRIVVVNTVEGGLIGHGLSSILSLQNLLGVQQSLGQAVAEETGGPGEG